MSTEPNTPEKKLIIDEDWKSQVEAEREAAQHPAEDVKPAEPQASAGARGPLPPPDLTFLIGTLYLQGAMALGLLPNPVTKQPSVQLEHAQHAIDLLAVLQQKTEGNRTTDESGELEAALHELRLAFIGVRDQQGTKT